MVVLNCDISSTYIIIMLNSLIMFSVVMLYKRYQLEITDYGYIKHYGKNEYNKL